MKTMTLKVMTSLLLFGLTQSAIAGSSAYIGAANIDQQIINDAKEDAAIFLKSGGVIRGANLQKAIEHVKSSNPQDESSDTTIATRIQYN